MIIHNVYFWLHDNIDQTGRDAFIDGLRLLMTDSNVMHAYYGTPATTPARNMIDSTYDYAIVVLFDDIAAHDAYQIGAIHDRFLADYAAKFKRVTVYDTVITD